MFTGLDKFHFNYVYVIRFGKKPWVWAFSLRLEFVINPKLIAVIVDKWNKKDRVFRFSKIEISFIVEEYARLMVFLSIVENLHLIL